MDLFTLVSSKMARNMDTARWSGPMEISTKVSGSMVARKVKVLCIGSHVGRNTKDSGRKINQMEKALTFGLKLRKPTKL
jgi:ACT domain-containing protein